MRFAVLARTNAACAEQSSPISFVSITKQEVNKMYLKSCRSANVMFSLLPRGYPACPVKTGHSPTVFVYTRIYMRMNFGRMNYAFVQPDQSLRMS